jgi:hypothetical protein
MNIQDILLSASKDDIKGKNFYVFCGQKVEPNSLKELLSNPKIKEQLNIRILSQGLLGALENGLKENMAIIGAYVLNNNVLYDIPPENDYDSVFDKLRNNTKRIANLEGLNIMFNAATNFKQIKLSKLLTQRYSILENSITNQIDKSIELKGGAHKESAKLNEDGSLSITSIKSGPVPQYDLKIKEYALNPILFNLKNFNPELLDDFLNDEHKLDPSVVKHGLVMNVFLENTESVLYLFANEKCANIIKNSDDIKAFINSDTHWGEKKQTARTALSLINLKDELPINNTNTNSVKPKI